MQPVVIGNATLYLGDCREILSTLEFGCVVTDPPYGVSYSSSRGGKFEGVKINNDDDVSIRDEVISLLWGKPALVFGSWKRAKPKNVKQTLIWDKGDHVGMGDLSLPWKPNTEEIYVIGSGFDGHRGSSVIRINAPSPNFTTDAKRYHPTEKPVALLEALIAKCPGSILDPFMGAGSTGIAALNCGRKFIGCELDKSYFDIACRRIEDAQRQGRMFE